ncbi:helix-turn-helix domain-containing protein [Microbacterium sp. CR_7]|uniref:helix-turn-helix domain-containing protein n=1 Tax=Microbacterium sp. CR_7 TaxID=3055792 RepID=UPI0035C07DA2
MGKNSTPKTYIIGASMNKGTFESFIRHFPNKWLRNAGKILGDNYTSMERVSFYAVAKALVEVGDFEDGSNFRLSQMAIADICGASPKTVRRVLNLLEMTGAIEVAEKSKRPGGGTPVKNYRLVYSQNVHDVTQIKDRNRDRDLWKREPRGGKALGSTTLVQPVAQPQALGSTTLPSREHNPTKGMSMNINTNAHTPPSSEPSAPSGVRGEESNTSSVDEVFDIDLLLGGVEDEEPQSMDEKVTHFYQLADSTGKNVTQEALEAL